MIPDRFEKTSVVTFGRGTSIREAHLARGTHEKSQKARSFIRDAPVFERGPDVVLDLGTRIVPRINVLPREGPAFAIQGELRPQSRT
jgi:hypothetical protein